jgi:hypothetical protein
VPPEIVIGMVSAVISFFALVVAYVTYRGGKQTAEEASKLSFQTAKNAIRTEVNK